MEAAEVVQLDQDLLEQAAFRPFTKLKLSSFDYYPG